METQAVVGRERELSWLESFLDAVPAGPVGLLLGGEVGVGKTTLWKEAVAARPPAVVSGAFLPAG